jgi:RND family efflux transporter MFP subunit
MRFQETPALAKGFALYIPNVEPGLAPRRGALQRGTSPVLQEVRNCMAKAGLYIAGLTEKRRNCETISVRARHGVPLPPAESALQRWNRSALCFLSLALALLLLPSCSKKSPGGEGEDTEEGTANIVAEVTVTRLGRADIQSTLSVSGTVSALPNQDVRVSSLVPGRVARMTVAEGDHIREGQVLAKIDDRPFRDQVQQAQAAVDQAKANLENSRLNLQRNESLLERGIAARKDLEDARTQASVNKAALSQAEAALSLVRLNLSRTEVRSPLTGMIVKRLLSVGEQVDGTAAQPVFEVASTSEVELFGNVPALYLDKIRVGQALQISTEAFPGKTFQSNVVAISPAVDPATNVGLVRIRMANGAGLLRLGMFLTAQVPLETHRNALVAPLEAVYRDQDGNPEIYRVQGEKAEAVPVKLGLETKDRIELLSGAQEGETIILGGGYGLPAQAKIKVKS